MADSPTTDQSPTSTEGAPTMPNFTGPTVPVMAGKTVYHVHEALVANASVFFANALKPEWRSDPSAHIDLSDESEEAFEGFMQWLYTGMAPNPYPPEAMFKLAKLYVLGEKLQATELQNAVVDAIIARVHAHDSWPGVHQIRIIYKGTTSNSPARRLMADMCAFSIDFVDKPLEKLDPEQDGEFMRDLIVAMTTYRVEPMIRGDPPWRDSSDTYLLNTKKE